MITVLVVCNDKMNRPALCAQRHTRKAWGSRSARGLYSRNLQNACISEMLKSRALQLSLLSRRKHTPPTKPQAGAMVTFNKLCKRMTQNMHSKLLPQGLKYLSATETFRSAKSHLESHRNDLKSQTKQVCSLIPSSLEIQHVRDLAHRKSREVVRQSDLSGGITKPNREDKRAAA